MLYFAGGFAAPHAEHSSCCTAVRRAVSYGRAPAAWGVASTPTQPLDIVTTLSKEWAGAAAVRLPG